jgi:hypothetical protein
MKSRRLICCPRQSTSHRTDKGLALKRVPGRHSRSALGQCKFRPRLLCVRSTHGSRRRRFGRHVGNGPCVDGSGLARRIFTSQYWSEQPCVRPVCAVHLTAGHNALRGSGPGQNRAFEDAVAQVGCPDRRIDRHCITCCSSSQPLRHAGGVRRDLVYAVSETGSL